MDSGGPLNGFCFRSAAVHQPLPFVLRCEGLGTPRPLTAIFFSSLVLFSSMQGGRVVQKKFVLCRWGRAPVFVLVSRACVSRVITGAARRSRPYESRNETWKEKAARVGLPPFCAFVPVPVLVPVPMPVSRPSRWSPCLSLFAPPEYLRLYLVLRSCGEGLALGCASVGWFVKIG